MTKQPVYKTYCPPAYSRSWTLAERCVDHTIKWCYWYLSTLFSPYTRGPSGMPSTCSTDGNFHTYVPTHCTWQNSFTVEYAFSLCACTTVDSPLCSLMTSGTSLQASLRKIHYLSQPLAKILTTNELIYGFSLVKQSSQEKAPLTERHGNACHYHSPPHPPTY